MTITISNLTVPLSAPTGTIIGVLTATDAGSIIPCNFILSKQSSGYFAISSNNLITVWSGSTAPGYYPVRVRAVGINQRFSGAATVIINVIASPLLPTPTGVRVCHDNDIPARQFARRDYNRNFLRIHVRWLFVRRHSGSQPNRHCCSFGQHAVGTRARLPPRMTVRNSGRLSPRKMG